MKKAATSVGVAWLITALYYFYQYVLRSAPAVMMPELSQAFGIATTGVATLAGLFYYGYSPFSLVAGVALDRFGPRTVVPLGAAVIGVGALLFASGAGTLAGAGRFLQGAGGVFALLGSVYLATTYFPASRAATLIGATQMFGMAGGFAGQIVVGPAIASGLPWSRFWAGMGIAGLVLCALLFALLPRAAGARRAGGLKEAGVALASVFRNPQSILCGLIAGLLFIPTTIFDMVWGVRYLQEGHGFDYGEAVMRSSTVPLGWMIGCPLLGFISDRIGRRKPVILGGALVLLAVLAWALFGVHGFFRGAAVGVVMGIASGAAMLPYTVIKEVNPPELGGSATGVVNFINFTFSALLGPVFGRLLVEVSGGSERMALEHYQAAFKPMLFGVVAAVILTAFLKETGPAAPKTASVP